MIVIPLDCVFVLFLITVPSTPHSNPREGICCELVSLKIGVNLSGACGTLLVPKSQVITKYCSSHTWESMEKNPQSCSNLFGNEEVSFARSVIFLGVQEAICFVVLCFVFLNLSSLMRTSLIFTL